MVSKNNIQLKDRYATKQVPHYGIRKLSVGVASVLLSTTLYMGVTAHADTIVETNPQPTIDQPASTATGNATGSVQLKPTADQSESTTTNSPVSETNASSKPVQTVSPEQSADTTGVQPASDQLESAAANSNAPENNGSAKSAPIALPKQPANSDTQSAATTSGVQPFVNLAVESDNNDLTPKHETIDSQWTIHYVNQADHQQELKDPTVITMQYTRTDTPHSDGTTQYGDWSYVPGSFKQTGTPITVKDSNNPVKQDNVDKNGENFDVFTITAMYPTVAGYEFHDGVNGTRLRDNLRNNERQADSMSKDFYAEYDVVKPTRETVGSQWRIHYIDSTNHEHELKAPTVINLQYTRTNTPQSDGTIQHGDWSYVPGSFKLTGTPITVNDSNNPVKEDNIDNNGKNEDVFTIDAMYPTITGYNFHDGINNVRLHDHLLNYDPNGSVQAPTIGQDFDVEYDPIGERSVAVKFVDDQFMGQQFGQAITLTGRDGDTVKVNVTVPDKYQLANGQQLPTTYTFTAGSGDVTIHLVHKVVQREATVNVKLVMMTGVDIEGIDFTRMTTTQERWKQLGDKVNITSPEASYEISPLVEVGTLTGHVNYDVVDNSVVSLGDDWTALNLGGRIYQLPNGTDVVNGVLTDSDDGSLGKPLREYYLTHYSIFNPGHSVDPDYATRPWYGYLSVNETNDPNSPASEWNDLGLQGGLAGNEPNALAKANGDRAATAVEMANKPIDASLLSTDFFSEQDGRLQATLPVPVVGVYVPYVEKTATRTINVTNPDGKTIAVKQTVTLAKQIDFNKDAHPSWTTSEWTSYDVPVIPGYTASQSNVAKEAVTGATNDQTVNITYTANPQTATVVYQTEDGTPVHTTTVNGHTGQTVKVSNEVPVGWKIINGKVPSEITFGSNGTPKTVVTIAHSHVTVTPDAPKTTSDKLPDNPAKTYPAGVSHDDLNKTVIRTIKVTTPDGQTKTIEQTAKLTRTADVDEVTGEVTYGKWSTGQWGAYDVPTVPGYTASQTSVAATSVDGSTKDQTVDINYTANSQTIHINYVDSAGKIVQSTAVTGKTGETVSLNLTVPDKYQLADGQQLPTTYAFASYNGDITIHVAHKVVQREATVDVQMGLETAVRIGDGDLPFEFPLTITQNQWNQLDDKIKDHGHTYDRIFPLVKVGTLTGPVNYDLVDNKVVSFGDDWTTLNLGGHTYQMPDGTEVVNGIFVDYAPGAFGKSLKEEFLKYYPDTDPDYANRPWHGYLSVNATNNGLSNLIHDSLQAGLVGNEPNTLAKANGDQAVTAVKSANKTVDSNWLKGKFDTSEFSEQNGQLRGIAELDVVGIYVPYVEKTATRTINVTMPDGKTTAVKQTATLAKQVDFGKDAHPDWTTGEWTSYDVPTIPGYTASQSQVAKETVTGETKDQTINITYTANDQSTHVNYMDAQGKTIHSTTVNGKTGQTVKVSSEIPDGWKLVDGQTVPSEITFGPDGHADTAVKIEHQHVTVKPDAPRTTTDYLPDNPGKTYPAGVGRDDLNKTVTGTIKATMPDGQVKTVLKTAKLTRTADVDEVTGEVKYSDWTTGYWSDYTAPVVPGYTADVPHIAGQLVTDTTEDQTIEITYTANPQTTHVNYVDTQGNLIHVTTVNGQTNQTVKVSSEIPDGWKLVDGQTVPNTITFGPDGHADTSVKIEHKYVTVDPDRPQTNGTRLPDNPKQLFHGVEASDLNKTVTRTIKVTTPDGQTKTVAQTVKLTRTATVDEVTGDVTYSNWTTGQWAKYDVPAVNGYTSTQTEVAAVSVNEHTTDQTVNVTYTPDAQKLSVKFIDDTTGQVLKTVAKTGVTNAAAGYNTQSDIQSYEGQHYVLVSDSSNGANLVFDNDDNIDQAYEVHLRHGAHQIDEHHTITQTVHYIATDHASVPDDHTVSVQFDRDGYHDEVTGTDHWNAWTPATGTFVAVLSPVIVGYTPSRAMINHVDVHAGDKDLDTTVTYVPDRQVIVVNYIDQTTGKTLKIDTLNGHSDQTSDYTTKSQIDSYLGQHYKLISDATKGQTLTFDHDDHATQTYDVVLGHETEVAHRTHEVHETVDYVYADGSQAAKSFTAQPLVFSQSGVHDLVTNTTDWNGDWTHPQEFAAVESPKIIGFTASKPEVKAVEVTHQSGDVRELVIYAANAQTAQIKYIDDVTGKTLETDGVNGHFNESIVFGHNVNDQINKFKQAHYKLVSNNFAGQKYQADNTKNVYEVHLTHERQNVHDTDSVTETVKFQYDNGSKAQPTKTQTVNFGRDGIKDLVTGTIAWMPVDPQTIGAVNTPHITGYTADVQNVPVVTVNFGDADITKVVTYKSNDQLAGIKYIDDTTGKVLNTQVANGKFGTEIHFKQDPDQQVIDLQAQHYELVSDNFKHQKYQADNEKNQFEIHVKHQMMDVQRTDKVTETIHYLGPDGDKLAPDKTQTITFTRHGIKDQVTGQIDWNSVEPQEFNAVKSPVINGYQADIAVVEGRQVLFGDQDVVVNVHYTKLPEQQPGKQPGIDMVNTDKVTPEKVVTVANGTVQEIKQDGIKNSGQSTVQDATQLPQTGNDNRAGLLSLIGGSLMASLAVFGLGKKKKDEN